MTMKILTFSTLYPDSSRPEHGIFVQTRLRHLVASGRVSARVVAPVPWFPFKSSVFGSYSAYASVPREEEYMGLRVSHPRYLLLPKVGMTRAPAAMAKSGLAEIRRLMREGLEFDLIDAHYFYPDGVAAAMIARALGKPLTITARGTDLNLIPNFDAPRRMILEAAEQASGLITVCQALKDVLVELGVPDEKVHALRNGVDLELFQPPADREALRGKLGIGQKGERTLLSVGGLIERKGHDLVIRALSELPDTRLLIAGRGPEKDALEALARELGVADRVELLGPLPQSRLREYYGAVDALVLASSREGWANVLLESMACGTPVVATSIWGTPEVVASPEAGVLVDERAGPPLAEGARRLFESAPDRAATRRYAEGFSWDDTTAGQIELFDGILNGERSPAEA